MNRDQELVIRALSGRNDIYGMVGKNDDALADSQRALSISKKCRSKKHIADSLINLSNVYGSISKYDAMLHFSKRSLAINEELNDRKGIASNLNDIAYMHERLGNYKKALVFYTQALKVRKKIGDRQTQAVTLNNIGFTHERLGDHRTALKYLKNSLKIREEIGDRQGQAISLNNLGMIQVELGDLRKARQYLVHAETIARKIKDKDMLQKIAVASGGLELSRRDADRTGDKAKSYAATAMKLAEELKSKAGKAEALLLQARIDMAENKAHSAEDMFNEAIAIFEELKLPYDIGRVYYYYGVAWKQNGRDGDGKFKKAREIFARLGLKTWLLKVNQALDRIVKEEK